MKRLTCLVVFGMLAIGVFAACGGGSNEPQVMETPIPTPVDDGPKVGVMQGDLAPDFVFVETVNDPTFTATKLSDLRGKVVLINFWASWCPACDKEMPSLQALYERYRDKDFVILGVNSLSRNETREKLVNYMRNKGLTFPSVVDASGEIDRTYHIPGLPATFILDKNGVIVHVLFGSRDWYLPGFNVEIERLLSE